LLTKFNNGCWLSLTTVIEQLVKGLSVKILKTVVKYVVSTQQEVDFGNGSSQEPLLNRVLTTVLRC
jgi:hypothetical protein